MAREWERADHAVRFRESLEWAVTEHASTVKKLAE